MGRSGIFTSTDSPQSGPWLPAPHRAAHGRGLALAAVFLLIFQLLPVLLCCSSLSFQLCSTLFIIIIIISASADGLFGSFSLNIYLQVVLPLTRGFPLTLTGSCHPGWAGRLSLPPSPLWSWRALPGVAVSKAVNHTLKHQGLEKARGFLEGGSGQAAGAPGCRAGWRASSLPRETKQMLCFKNLSLCTVSSVRNAQDRKPFNTSGQQSSGLTQPGSPSTWPSAGGV